MTPSQATRLKRSFSTSLALSTLLALFVGCASDSPEAATCASHCRSVLASCMGANRQYDGFDPLGDCEVNCAAWSAGTSGDARGDTLACRRTHLSAASSDAVNQCPQLGPLGAGVCGASQCDDFCDLVASACRGSLLVYNDRATCMSDCMTYRDRATPFTSSISDGSNTLRCRGYHLTRAVADPNTHCQHTGGPNAIHGNSAVCTQ